MPAQLPARRNSGHGALAALGTRAYNEPLQPVQLRKASQGFAGHRLKRRSKAAQAARAGARVTCRRSPFGKWVSGRDSLGFWDLTSCYGYHGRKGHQTAWETSDIMVLHSSVPQNPTVSQHLAGLAVAAVGLVCSHRTAHPNHYSTLPDRRGELWDFAALCPCSRDARNDISYISLYFLPAASSC